jgi:hypothetical protein
LTRVASNRDLGRISAATDEHDRHGPLSALLPTCQDTHPLGCHRPRIPDRIVFDKLIQILVFGCGYRRIADASCSATTLRRRRVASRG